MTTSRKQGSIPGSFHLRFTEFIPAESDETFQYEEVIEEDSSLPEEEEDLEATVLAVKQRSDVIQPAATQPARNTNTRAGVCPPPEAVDDYLRNFLLKMGMTKTLDCFQTEWNEMLQKGLLNTELVGVVADVYIQNHRLDSELTSVHRERDEYRSMASATAETLTGLQKARDFHRMHHKRVLQEKNRLIEDMKKLKAQCGRYEPAVRQISERYQSVFRQKMLVSLERDKALAQVQRLQATLHNMEPSEGGQSLNQDARQARCKTKNPSKKTPEPSGSVKHVAGDSKFPVGRGRNNSALSMEGRTMDSDAPNKAKADGFQLRSTIKAHSRPISCLAHHPSKCAVASSSDDRMWKLWGLPAGDLGASGEGHTDWLSGVGFHPDETKLGTTGGDGSVRIWDLARGQLVLSLRGHSAATWRCSFHSCGDFVASCSMDTTIKVWDLQSERCRSTLRGHRGSVNSVDFLGSSGLLSASADKTLRLWDARTALCCQTVRGHSSPLNAAAAGPCCSSPPSSPCCSSPSSSPPSSSSCSIASCDSSGVVMLWDLRNLAAPSVVVETGPRPSNQVAFDPWGRMLAVAGEDGSARVVDLSTNQVAGVLHHDAAVQSVTFDPTGAYLLSGASDGKIYVWS
ncbi:unnamed protein product [Arctogadus glacialis]